jgi:hypothetical protein
MNYEIFGLKNEDVSESWKKLYNKETGSNVDGRLIFNGS